MATIDGCMRFMAGDVKGLSGWRASSSSSSLSDRDLAQWTNPAVLQRLRVLIAQRIYELC